MVQTQVQYLFVYRLLTDALEALGSMGLPVYGGSNPKLVQKTAPQVRFCCKHFHPLS